MLTKNIVISLDWREKNSRKSYEMGGFPTKEVSPVIIRFRLGSSPNHPAFLGYLHDLGNPQILGFLGTPPYFGVPPFLGI